MHLKKYQQIGLGGTFDHFHAGHAKFLSFSFELATRILIGITSDRMTLHKPYSHLIQSYEERVAAVTEFCQSHQIKYKIVELHDAFGPTVENPVVQALSVTPETVPGANKINELRANLNLYQLPVYICDYFLDSQGKPLHAESIRAGLVNRQGQVYGQLWQTSLKLSETQKSHFQTPQGELVESPSRQVEVPMTAVVGDYCLETFLKNKWSYSLAVYDLHEQRQATTAQHVKQLKSDIEVENPAGEISLQLIEVLKKALKSKLKHVLVAGEEDLAAVALVLLLPLNSRIYYGQPNQGMVEMIATEELKNQFFKWLQ